MNLSQKKEKMIKEVDRFSQELLELQEQNYAMYWDVAARFAHNQDQYEDFLELEDVPRGLTIEQLKEFMNRHMTTRKESGFNGSNECQNENCCICC